jgi:CBS-domain-containing membrane protein
MMWTGSVHPPAAAAVMAAVDGARLQALGFGFVVYPTVVGGAPRRLGFRGIGFRIQI